jgi:hypothetical protein
MSGPLIQNFSIPADDSAVLNVQVNPVAGVTLVGSTIFWRVFEQEFGIPIPNVSSVLVKSTDHGIQIDDPDLLKFHITVDKPDTVGLLRNYYHEARIEYPDNTGVTIMYGILTVGGTEVRPS